MKMENTLYAERDCVVAKINYEPGESLAVDDRIMEME
jgi:biotin carboxyl carrier protein